MRSRGMMAPVRPRLKVAPVTLRRYARGAPRYCHAAVLGSQPASRLIHSVMMATILFVEGSTISSWLRNMAYS